MERPLWFRWLKVYALGGVIIGSGVLLFKYTTPSDEQLIKSLSPELRLQYEKERNLRQAEQEELMKIVRNTAESKDPIWKTGPIQSPWERNPAGTSENGNGIQNIDDHFQRLNAEKAQREELDRIRQKMDTLKQDSQRKTESIINGRTKSWWKFW
ncbi:hypothetical protein NCAS_0A06940 [Naumovozyma castellii]|uniref:Cytochrome b mRNA-processing protein 4 n=1 Tax=Naumovozyma castellii TaxID=27288 RepID=G0V704_NAUCA|nr:hypothetical protein NCAS_0A06940 [Naumovozyma castellii CBS 4309]CCC67252.1 hypothetical protein NCAS_0A06940 [Naumovozyma castellii CBS 4309]